AVVVEAVGAARRIELAVTSGELAAGIGEVDEAVAVAVGAVGALGARHGAARERAENGREGRGCQSQRSKALPHPARSPRRHGTKLAPGTTMKTSRSSSAVTPSPTTRMVTRKSCASRPPATTWLRARTRKRT